MACADVDLECLAAAAQQLQHLERLDLEEVEVGISYACSGLPHLRDCTASYGCLHQVLPTSAP